MTYVHAYAWTHKLTYKSMALYVKTVKCMRKIKWLPHKSNREAWFDQQPGGEMRTRVQSKNNGAK